MTPVQITQAGPDDLPAIRDLYAQAGYGAAIDGADTVLMAKVDGQLAGVVRLCMEQGVTVLRGMQVQPAFQRQGVGSALLAACVPVLDRGPAYCLPYTHLTGFYGALGFEPVGADQLPAFLACRLAGYLDKGQQVLAMRRNRSGAA
jgi:N-acetylglutamate synthase-like GNAT family acetyltransferase